MEEWSLEVVSLDDFATRLLSEETIADIDQMFVELPENEERGDKLTLLVPALSHWTPESSAEANGHKNGASHSN